VHIRLDKLRSGPIYRQIAEGLKGMILDGSLADGQRLPASRELAKSLNVNRITVTTAYDILERQGLVVAHVGRGTFVRAPEPAATGRPGRAESRGSTSQFWASQSVEGFSPTWIKPVLHAPEGTIFLDYALPPTDLFLVDQFRSCLNDALRRNGGEALQMGPTDGYPPLKEYIAAHMTGMGMSARPEEILITNGCQQALDLVRRVFVGYEDTVVLEEPTYPGAITVFSGARVRRLTIPVGEDGPDMEALESVLAGNRVKLIYTIPNFHNPTGATMSLEKRARLLELAQIHRLPVVEDDTYVELRYGGGRLPSLKASDDHGIVLYLNSFSKVNFPGIRVGWIAGPQPAIEQLEAAKRTCDLHTDLLAQTGLYEFCRRGLLEKHLKRVRKIYKERRDAMVSALERHLAPSLKWTTPEGGLALWATAPPGVDSERLLRAAVARGVAFSCGKGFYSGPPDPRTLRLCFAAEAPDAIEHGVRRLALALEDTLAESKRGEAQRTLSGRPMV
jgi:2-aminoadipate transaminase